MNAEFISRALCFHGQPLQKIWEDERGNGDLQQLGVAQDNNYTIYAERQKYFTFQDRAKRLKLHQFFSRKAVDLYSKNLENGAYNLLSDLEQIAKLEYVKPYIAAMPPFEIFVNKNQDKFKRLRVMLEGLKAGDVIYGVVTKVCMAQVMVKPLCTAEPLVRYLGDVTIKAYVQKPQYKAPLDSKGNTRSYVANDFVCCEIINVSVYTDRINLSMENTFSKNKNVKLGLVSADELPEYYRSANNNALTKYNDCLFKAKEFLNPNYDVLYELVGLNVKDTFTLMHKLKYPFPKEEYATELRQTQASKWAFRSVAEGIEHFKIGRHVEAFQCLNKALNIDPRNVEGLVARGALYANKGSFLKAVDDFEKALKLNSFHVNARKYMGETLVALGRSYEDDNRIDDAIKAYRDCLNIIPNHEQARLSLEILQQRPGSHLFDNLLNIPGTTDIDLNSIQGKNNRVSEDVSSSADSGSSDSDTDSDSSADRSQAKRDHSLSPLSKRMAAQVSGGNTSSSTNAKANYNQPFFLANQNSMESNKSLKIVSNEFRLDDDDETESRVRKLLQDASKYKKQKSKKSKKKKSKKSKKDSRKNKSEPTASTFGNSSNINYQEALKVVTGGLSGMPKLNENLHIYEQTIAQIKKQKEALVQPGRNNQNISQGDSPPPKAPSMRLSYDPTPPPPTMNKKSATGITSSRYGGSSSSTSAAINSSEEAPRFSFTIRRPVKVDKFGLIRIATPVTSNKSPNKSDSRSRTRSRSRSPTRSRRRRSRHSRSRDRNSRSCSPDNSRNRRRRDSRSRRSSSRNRRYRRTRSRSRSPRSRRVYGRRRTPSPFVPRGTPPRRRNSRSHARPSPPRKPKNFGNLVWQRPGYKPPTIVESSMNSDRWEHDQFYSNKDEGPSIEEIDEIINKAQKERKEEIIKRDKNILKKNL